MDALQNLASPSAKVVRDGQPAMTIPSGQVVLGDLVQVEVGDVVPADLRLLSSMNFETDEALLTGEALPIAKDHSATWPSDDVDIPVGGELARDLCEPR